MRSNPIMSLDDMQAAAKELTGNAGPANYMHEHEAAVDDLSGAELDPKEVRSPAS